MKSNLTKRDLSTFSLLDVKRYLKDEKWHIIDQSPKAIIFEGPQTDSGNPLIFKLPASEENSDYFERIRDIVNILAAIKETQPHIIINQIALMNNDILRVRVLNPGENKFSIPLDIAASEIEALKTLFIYAATSEVKPRPSFDRPLSNGVKYANQCQFGHTFEGSFGFTINSPIKLADYTQMSLFEQELVEIPFERKVMERIADGFLDIEKAYEKNDINIIVENFENGLNSKMCDSLIALSIEKSKQIEYSVEWSPRINPSKKIDNFSNIIVEEPKLEIIEEASKKLKFVEPFDEILIGPIITLHSNKEPFSDEEFTRSAIIKHEFEGRKIDVKLELDKNGYEVAYNAHGEGKTVQVEGSLFKKGATWRMINIRKIDTFHK
jgi:hypothetical protein